jgi:nucleoside-diphosphate-sugar epimerase
MNAPADNLLRVFITGGAGYVGAVLVPKLLVEGYSITVYDLMLYGENVLPEHDALTVIKGDIRDEARLRSSIGGHDAVIHLACISNDPSFELNPTLGKSINLDAFRPLVEASRDGGVGRFIYASSSSVYGIKTEPNVHEDMTLEPLTDYSRFKADCEKILAEYQSPDFTTVTIRPATVCGYSPRQRLDVVVNILTNLAWHNREITVFGGSQLRPNLHIKDMANAYLTLLRSPRETIAGEIFNFGCENHTVQQLAEMIQAEVGEDVTLKQVPTDDNRSYHISSEKVGQVLGLVSRHPIQEAVRDLCSAFDQGLLPDSLGAERYFNVRIIKAWNDIQASTK